MPKFSQVLFKNKNFFFLWIGQIISQLGDRLDQMALIAFIYARSPGSAFEIAKMLTFTIIPVFLVGPLAGVYVDRWDRRRTMYICDLLRALLVLTIPLFLFYSKHLYFVYGVIFLTFCVGRFFVPAKLAIIPDLVNKDELLIANSLVNTTGMIAAIMGFGIGGVLIEVLGPKRGFYLDSLSFLISAGLIFLIVTRHYKSSLRIKEFSKDIIMAIRKSVFQEIKEGVIYFIKQKQIRFTASILFLLWAALGAVYVVIIVFIQSTLHSATKDLGLLIMFLGIGLFLGSLFYGRFGEKLSHYKVIFISLVFSGMIIMLFAITLKQYPYFLIAAVFSFILGAVVAPIVIACNTLIHHVSDNNMMGKVFSSLEIVMHLGFLLAMFVSSILAEKVPQSAILIFVGAVFSVLGLVNYFHSPISTPRNR